MELVEISAPVFACLQEDRGLGTSNSGLVNRGGGLVIDTFWDLPHTRQMIDLYSRVWREPPRRVLNTHHNGDHCWGNQLFPEAEIIGHRLCAASFGREQPAVMEQLRHLETDDPALAALSAALRDWDFSGVELRPPTVLVEDQMVLDLDGTRVELLYVGPAHTAGDVIAHIPEARVVFTGDVLFRRCTPIGWDGTFAAWMAALDRIQDLAPEVIVPGHGPICGLEGPREMRAYLEYVYAESRTLFGAGVPELEAAARIDPGPYASWTEPERIVFLVERAYRELRGGPDEPGLDAFTLLRAMHEIRQRRAGGTAAAG